ncbi:MAG TPA: mannosyltransferase family protein [Clostridia bacterium]|nr:mannosyltransferase family protein [Clostridia bacterium]
MKKSNLKINLLGDFWRRNWRAIVFILAVFVFWQVALSALSRFSPSFLPTKMTFLYQEEIPRNPQFLWSRANFDGVHYLYISRFGYGLYQQAFFPGYPWLISALKPVWGGSDLLAAVLIANFCLWGFLLLFYRLISLDYQEKVARQTILFFLLFPTAFFLGMVYTESLFLLLIIGSFYAARKGNWWLAGALGGLSSYVRLGGIFLLPALAWEWYQQNHKNLRTGVASLPSLLLIPAGLLAYMKFLWEKYQDPLLFFHVQSYFGAERSGGKIILLYQVFWRYLKMALTTKLDPLYFTVWLEIGVAVGFLLLLFLAYKKGVRTSYLIFGIISYLVPTCTGTFSSMPRYVLALFPCFIYLGTIKNKLLYYFLALIFSFLLILCSVFFYQGYWIA